MAPGNVQYLGLIPISVNAQYNEAYKAVCTRVGNMQILISTINLN